MTYGLGSWVEEKSEEWVCAEVLIPAAVCAAGYNYYFSIYFCSLVVWKNRLSTLVTPRPSDLLSFCKPLFILIWGTECHKQTSTWRMFPFDTLCPTFYLSFILRVNQLPLIHILTDGLCLSHADPPACHHHRVTAGSGLRYFWCKYSQCHC